MRASPRRHTTTPHFDDIDYEAPRSLRWSDECAFQYDDESRPLRRRYAIFDTFDITDFDGTRRSAAASLPMRYYARFAG